MKSEEDAALVPHLLVRLVERVCRHPHLVLFAALIVAGTSFVASQNYLEYHTQRTDLVSPHKDYQQRWRAYLAEFGDDDDMVVVVEGSDRQRMQDALEQVAGQVREHPELFDRLFYKVDLSRLANRALLYLPGESIQSLQDNLQTMRPLLELGPWSWRALGLTSLMREARQRVGAIDADGPIRPTDEAFFRQLLAICQTASATLDDPLRYRSPWHRLVNHSPEEADRLNGPRYFFSNDGSLAYLLVRPIKEPGSFTAAEHSVEALRSMIARSQQQFPDIAFGLTGIPVLETDEMKAVERDTRLASWLAIAGITLLFLLVYRGFFYPIMTMATLLVGTAWALGWLTLTIGHLNLLTATFAVMLIGMGDYGVLWVMRYEAARRAGADVRTALLHTTRHVAVGNLTAASTLALAFFAAMLADLRAVAELGWIAGCGVLLCALACFTVFPALMMILDRRKITNPDHTATGSDRSFSGTLCFLSGSEKDAVSAMDPWAAAPWPEPCRPAVVIVAGVAATLVLGWIGTRLGYDANLLHMHPHGLESVRWELKLLDRTQGASWHAVSYTSTPEEALALKQRYLQLPGVSLVAEVASLIPADQPAKIEQLKDIQQRLRHLPPRGKPIPHSRPALADVRAELASLIEQLQQHAGEGADSGQGSLAALLVGSRQLQQQLTAINDTNLAEKRLQKFDERLSADLVEDLHRLRDAATPLPITKSDLPADLRERYVGQTGKWLVRVFAADSLWDFARQEEFCRQVRTVDPKATGKPVGIVEGLKAMKSGFEWAGVYAFFAIVAVLLLDFRCWKVTLLALMPLVMGVAMTLGTLVLCGVSLNPANLMAFPLILGVGIDNGVHVLHDYLIRRRLGLATISRAIGRGVLVKALTTMIGFGTLMLSSQRGLASLGLVLTVGVGCCMITALVFLPAVLRLLPLPESNQQTAPQPARQAA